MYVVAPSFIFCTGQAATHVKPVSRGYSWVSKVTSNHKNVEGTCTYTCTTPGLYVCLFVNRSRPSHAAWRGVRVARRGAARRGAARCPRAPFNSFGLSTDCIGLPETFPQTPSDSLRLNQISPRAYTRRRRDRAFKLSRARTRRTPTLSPGSGAIAAVGEQANAALPC